MSVDQVIKDVGVSAVIVRTAGNISTSVYVYPKTANRQTYERDAIMPTDSTAISGDIFMASGISYLVKSLLKDERVGEVFLYRIKLLVCNHVISIKQFQNGAFSTVKTGVSCLITDGSATVMSDRGVVVPGFSGKLASYYLYAQAGAGINKNSLIVDDAGRSLRVAGGVNPYFADGLVEVPVMLEGA